MIPSVTMPDAVSGNSRIGVIQPQNILQTPPPQHVQNPFNLTNNELLTMREKVTWLLHERGISIPKPPPPPPPLPLPPPIQAQRQVRADCVSWIETSIWWLTKQFNSNIKLDPYPPAERDMVSHDIPYFSRWFAAWSCARIFEGRKRCHPI